MKTIFFSYVNEEIKDEKSLSGVKIAAITFLMLGALLGFVCEDLEAASVLAFLSSIVITALCCHVPRLESPFYFSLFCCFFTVIGIFAGFGVGSLIVL